MCNMMLRCFRLFFFFNDTATTEIYTLSLHDALPISAGHHRRRYLHRPGLYHRREPGGGDPARRGRALGYLDGQREGRVERRDRKSTRLNSSHANISYAVFCLKKKKSCKCLIKLKDSR